MLVRAGLQSKAGLKFDWRVLAKRLVSHSAKLRQAAVHDYFLDSDMEADADIVRLREALSTVSVANEMKNRSLYSGVVDNRYVEPREQITRAIALRQIKKSEDRVRFFLAAERVTKGAVEDASESELASLRGLIRLLGRS